MFQRRELIPQTVVLCMQAYDGHMNMVLSEVEETIYVVEIADITNESVVRVSLVSSGRNDGWKLSLMHVSWFIRLSRRITICCLSVEMEWYWYVCVLSFIL